jgi:hypothetical protein
MSEATTRPRQALARTVDCGLRLHGVPDRIVSTDLAGQLERHVSPEWWAVVMFSDGKGVCIGVHDRIPSPPEAAVQWMVQAAIALNREIQAGGHWVVAWSDAQEPVLVWRDGDGDIHVAVEVSVKAEQIEAYEVSRAVAMASQALAESRERVRWLENGPQQIVNLAQRNSAARRH